MANENQNTGPDNRRPDINETISSLKYAKESRDAQDDVNKAYKDSINLLEKMNKLIQDSVSKTQTYEKSKINTNRLERELEKIAAKRKTNEDNLAKLNQADRVIAEEYVKNLDKRKNLEDKLIRARAAGNNKYARDLQIELQNTQGIITQQESSLEIETLKAVQLTQQQHTLEERIKGLGEEIAKEKEVKKQVGLTGTLLKLSNKYLGVGGDLYGKIVEETREGENTTKKWVLTTGVLVGAFAAVTAGIGLINKGVTSLTGSGGPISKLVSPFTELISKIPLVGGLIGGIVDMLANVADFATIATSATELFARRLGTSYEQASRLRKEFSDISANTADSFYNSQKLLDSTLELSDALGINNRLSNDIVMANIKLKELGELDLDTRKQLAIVATLTGRDQVKLASTLNAQTQQLNKTLGVSFKWQQITKEVASLSGYLGLAFTKYPEKLQKSLMIVKATGLEMKQLDNIANSLLDYESSIASEFEAQLLTGKNINLSKARELFLNNKLADAAQEITKQVGSAEDFLKMNRFAAEGLAKSFGMSRDELANMLKEQTLFAKVGATDLKTYQEKLVAMKEAGKTQEDIAKLVGDEAASNFLNQTATERIANFFDKIKQSFADILSDPTFKVYLDKFMKFVENPENIKSLINGLIGFVGLMIKSIAVLLEGLDMLPFVSIDKGITDSLRGYANQIESMKLGGLSPEPTTVGAAVVKSASPSTAASSLSTPGLIGGGNSTPQYAVFQGNIIAPDSRILAGYTTQGYLTPYGSTDKTTGKLTQ